MNKVFGWIKEKLMIRRRDKYIRYIIVYTVLFFLAMSVILGLFTYYNKSFVNYVDAFSQHFITLKYFRNLLINFLETGNITTFTWNIGFGLDMFANLSYYAFGDIFSYFSIFVSESDLLNFYNISLIFRMWLIGLSFIFFCRYKNIKGIGVLIGAIIYTISANTFTQGLRNPYMLNASILFPLMMIGLDLSVVKNKNIFFVIIVAINFLSGFYFAYFSSIVLAFYGLCLIIKTYRRSPLKIVLVSLKTFLLALLALLISCVLILPSVMQFLSSSRNLLNIIYEYFNYSYRYLVNSFISNSTYNDNRIGLSIIFLIALPIFIKNRRSDYPTFLTTLFLIIAMFIPMISSFLVGLSFPLNRWVYLICFFLSYITAFTIKNNFSLDKKDIKAIFLFSSIYFFILFIYETSFNIQMLSQLVILFLLIFIYSNTSKLNKRIRLTSFIGPIVVTLGVLYNFYYYYSPTGSNNITSFVTNSNFYDYYDTAYNKIEDFSDAISYLKELDDSFYMVGKYPTCLQNYNSSLYYNYNSISYYYSINSNYYALLAGDLQNSQYNMSYELLEFDYRTRITSLLGTKYYITTNSKYVPYGYELVSEMDEENTTDTTAIYKNKYSINFGVIYNDYITSDDYENMNETEKEISMYKTTVLDSTIATKYNLTYFSNYDKVIKKDYDNITYTKVNNGTSSNDNKSNTITVLDTTNDYITINTNKLTNKEVYIKISGISYEALTDNEKLSINGSDKSIISIDRYFNNNKWSDEDSGFTVRVSSNGVSKSEQFRDMKTSPYYYEDDCVYINLGYFESFNGSIKISFSKSGHYSYDNIEVIAVNFDSYESDIKSLNKANFSITDISDNTMEATVNSSGGILQFSTIYSDGWTVYVDGEKVDTFVSNNYFLGIYIEKGNHEIKLVYETPYLSEGISLSRIGLIIFGILIIGEIIIFIYKTKRKRKDIH